MPRYASTGPLAPPHQVRLVRLVAVLVGAVVLAVDGHRADAQLRAGPEHPDGDLARLAHMILVKRFRAGAEA